LTRRTQTQQATRAIFIGFPSNQAGWLFYTENKIGTMHIHVSYDATFDENFDSALVFDTHPFQGSIAIRRNPTSNPEQMESFTEQEPTQSTGSITDFHNAALPKQNEEGSEESVNNPDESVTEVNQDNTENEYVMVEAPQDTENEEMEESQDTQANRYPNRIRRRNTKYFDMPSETVEQAMFMGETFNYDPNDERMHSSLDPYMRYIMPDFEMALSAIKVKSNEQVDIYLPEPQGIKSMLRLPPKQRNAWLKAYKLELKNLIEDNETFVIDTPKKGEKVIPTKPVFKAKQTQDGKLEKLKVREVARGDLEQHDEDEDTWSPGTSSCGVRMFLAQVAKSGRTPKQADFIGAYLQARVRGHHFVRLSSELGKYFPEYSKWFGIPL
jgi:hypothetical protein